MTDPSGNPSINDAASAAFMEFANTLSQELTRCSDDEQTLGDGHLVGESVTVEDPVNDLVQRMAVNRAIMGRIDRIMNPASVATIFATGDLAAARELASSISSVFAALLTWARDARNAVLAPEWQPIYAALANFSREPLRQISDFSIDVTTRATSMAESSTRSEPVHLALHLSVGGGDFAALSNAVAVADVVPQPEPRKKSRLFRH